MYTTHQQIVDALAAIGPAYAEKERAAISNIRTEQTQAYKALMEQCKAIGHIAQPKRFAGDQEAGTCVICNGWALPVPEQADTNSLQRAFFKTTVGVGEGA